MKATFFASISRNGQKLSSEYSSDGSFCLREPGARKPENRPIFCKASANHLDAYRAFLKGYGLDSSRYIPEEASE